MEHANNAALVVGHRLLIDDDPTRFQGAQVIGADEHVWSHAGHDLKYVRVIIDRPLVRAVMGTSRLLDLVPGRLKQVLKTWLTIRTAKFREGIEVRPRTDSPGIRPPRATRSRASQ